MMPVTSRRIPRHLKKDALGIPKSRSRREERKNNPPMSLSALELFFPIPNSLLPPPAPESSSSSSSSSPPLNTPKRKRNCQKRVSFSTDVEVVEIPSRQASSQDVKLSLWTTTSPDTTLEGEKALWMQDYDVEDSSWTETDDDLEEFIPITKELL